MPTTRIILEISANSAEDCLVAEAHGADRVELASGLAVGGLTPSLGALIEARQALTIPIVALARPRPGGFCYSAAEFSTLQRDVHILSAHGVEGVAFGMLRADGTVDSARCAQVIAQLGRCEAVFLRAFDVTPDPFAALEELVELGFRRVLTSGQAASAPAGAELIARLVEQAAGRIEILPGGGVRLENAAALLAATGCTQVHASLSALRTDSSTAANPDVRFGISGLPEDKYTATDGATVAAMRALLDTL